MFAPAIGDEKNVFKILLGYTLSEYLVDGNMNLV
jgi:hypothetical protein